MRGLRGDFLGFTFNNIHSSALGITRVLNGMMDIPLTPNLKDTTMEIAGQDGIHYYGSTYQQKNIVINFAFEGLSDEQISVIKTIWNDKKVHQLILDEYPYKVYNAKASGSSVLKHISFSKEEGGRTIRYYNGEGSFSFTCFFPYAISRFSYVEEYVINNIPEWIDDLQEADVLTLQGIRADKIQKLHGQINYNEQQPFQGTIYGQESDLSNFFNEVKDIRISAEDLTLDDSSRIYKIISRYNNLSAWVEASGLPKLSDGYGQPKLVNNVYSYKIKNPGNANAIIKIWFNLDKVSNDSIADSQTKTLSVIIGKYQQDEDGEELMQDSFEVNGLLKIDKTNIDTKLLVDCYNGVLCGFSESGQKSIELYNQYLKGEFFIIEPNEECIIKINTTSDNSVSLDLLEPEIEIQYLYN